MKKVMLFALAFLAIAQFAFAQRGGGEGRRGGSPEEMANRQTARMAEELDLSEAQVEKIKELNLLYAKKMRELRANAGDDRTGMREKMGALFQEKETELKKYLTTEQFEKYKKLEAERRARRRGGPGGMRGNPEENRPEKGNAGDQNG